MGSPGNTQYNTLRAFDLNKKTVTATCTLKVGADSDFFQIDNPVIVVDPAATTTITVPDGLFAGQEVFIANKSNSESSAITISVTHHYTSDPETFTITNEGQNLQLKWDGERWGTVGGTATAT
jgi:hypothetical protein